ncbi:hypothetical protein MKEN_00284900 [Mycena kentingensis (nom. inval.)]|nr:hypothetical protein MKEN_00284900 [Mycena kentingensis (nom. inval.)]
MQYRRAASVASPTMSASRVISIPKLATAILAHFDDTSPSLAAAALSCRGFLVPAQKRLFGKITLRSERGAARLRVTLAGSPHLAAYIHTLCFSYVASLPVPGLDLLRLRKLVVLDCQTTAEFAAATSSLVLSSIAEISVLSSASGGREAVQYLSGVLQHPLHELSLTCGPLPHPVSTPNPQPPRKLLVDNLVLDGTLADLHNSLSALVDFPLLQSVTYHSTEMEHLPALLSACSQRCEALTVYLSQPTSYPDLINLLPGIRTLTLTGITESSIDSVGGLLRSQTPPRSPGMQIILCVDVYSPSLADDVLHWAWQELDALVAGMDNVESVHLTMTGAGKCTWGEGMLQSMFPVLHGQGKISGA